MPQTKIIPPSTRRLEQNSLDLIQEETAHLLPDTALLDYGCTILLWNNTIGHSLGHIVQLFEGFGEAKMGVV